MAGDGVVRTRNGWPMKAVCGDAIEMVAAGGLWVGKEGGV